MRQLALATAGGIALIAALAAQPCLAQTAADRENVQAEDVALSPLADVNLRKKDIPALLQTAVERPYDLAGIRGCAGISTAIRDLDEVLGDDIDVAYGKSDDEKMGNSAGAVAKSVLGSFIPFRGVIRELSGANAQQRKWDLALYAGAVRRAFLKGMGEQRGCAYPARSATPAVVAALTAERERLDRASQAKPREEKTSGEPVEVRFESNPVVQPIKGSR